MIKWKWFHVQLSKRFPLNPKWASDVISYWPTNLLRNICDNIFTFIVGENRYHCTFVLLPFFHLKFCIETEDFVNLKWTNKSPTCHKLSITNFKKSNLKCLPTLQIHNSDVASQVHRTPKQPELDFLKTMIESFWLVGGLFTDLIWKSSSSLLRSKSLSLWACFLFRFILLWPILCELWNQELCKQILCQFDEYLTILNVFDRMIMILFYFILNEWTLWTRNCIFLNLI
jgi:hypothetical protein